MYNRSSGPALSGSGVVVSGPDGAVFAAVVVVVVVVFGAAVVVARFVGGTVGLLGLTVFLGL